VSEYFSVLSLARWNSAHSKYILQDGKTHVFAVADSKQDGIRYGDDWKDVLGMRGTQSGSISITNVSVPWSAALGFNEKKEFVPLGAFNTLLLPVSFEQGFVESFR